ncbi:MAG: branched-chain amino acid ABC transporter permease [Chloroflexi bacterium]|nr:MAG: branched-chain amino acid ABC transporter permease [Chloroflexota bacterium]TME18249.1 MAG: branched-chain amino acid ABC transporter permease [Chloroflexota bacterium]
MDVGNLVLFFLAGLSIAAVLFIVTAGLSLVFGALRVINMAHGSLYMIGAFVSWFVIVHLANALFGFWAALLVAPLITAIIGAVVEIFVLKPVYGKEHLLQLLGTYALTLIFAGLVRKVFGADVRSISAPAALNSSVPIFGHGFSVYQLFLIAVAVLVAAGLYLLLNRTGLGRNIRAAISDPQLLSTTGVNVTRLFTIVFMIGTALAGLGGVLVSPTSSVDPGMDSNVLINAFAISVIGGLGSLVGSLVGAVIVGLILSFGFAYPPTAHYAIAFVFAAMVIVLTIRPWGLFGRAEQ